MENDKGTFSNIARMFGSRGGNKTLSKYGKRHFQEIAKLPRKSRIIPKKNLEQAKFLSVSDISKITKVSRQSIYHYSNLGIIQPVETRPSLFDRSVINKIQDIKKESQKNKSAGLRKLFNGH